MVDQRNIREEVRFNAAEAIALQHVAGRLGLRKAEFIRMATLQLIEKVSLEERWQGLRNITTGAAPEPE